MGLEIERRFLLKEGVPLPESEKVLHLRQGYLVSKDGLSVRIRTIGAEKAFLTIKQTSKEDIAIRNEYEYEIPFLDALELMNLSTTTHIHKQRHLINYGGVTWEVDFFEEENEGLILAEVELPSIDTPLELPEWIGKEVSEDSRYLSSSLANTPFLYWEEKKEH